VERPALHLSIVSIKHIGTPGQRLRPPGLDRISGGLRRPTPGFFIFGYISCYAVIEGDVDHSGSHGECPHRIKVCATKKGNDRAVYARLESEAGPKPMQVSHAERSLAVIRGAGEERITRQDLLAEARLGSS